MTLTRKTATALTQYDPVKGVLKIHGAREKEKRARRERDLQALDAAIEQKLIGQAEFVVWWDTEAERRHREDGGRGRKKTHSERGTSFLRPEDFGLTVKILSGWRTTLTPLEKLGPTVEAEQEHARRRLERDLNLAELHEQRQAERLENLAAIARGNAPLGQAERFPIIYADPPWRYEHVETENRAIENQYPTMALDEICALPIDDIVTPDSVLFLWATSPKLAEAMQVIEAWAFTYRTSMVWVKDRIGMGYYARQQHELLLIAARGTPPLPAPADRPASVIVAPRTTHSAKPDGFAVAIARMYPSLPKIELFARAARDGWTSWGNQAG